MAGFGRLRLGLGLGGGAQVVESAAPAAPTIAFASHAQHANSATPTLAGMAIGAAQDDRVIIAIVNFNGSTGTPSAPTVSFKDPDGVYADIAADNIVERDLTTNWRTAMFAAAVPLGATVDVAVTVPGGSSGTDVNVCLLRATNIQTAASQTASTSGTLTSVTPSIGVTIDVPEGGIAVGFMASNGYQSMSWTGIDELDDWNDSSSNGSGMFAAGSQFAAAQTGLSVTCGYDAYSSNRSVQMGVASFAKAA